MCISYLSFNNYYKNKCECKYLYLFNDFRGQQFEKITYFYIFYCITLLIKTVVQNSGRGLIFYTWRSLAQFPTAHGKNSTFWFLGNYPVCLVRRSNHQFRLFISSLKLKWFNIANWTGEAAGRPSDRRVQSGF